MPNWCSSAYVIEGDAKEIKSLYEMMKGLQDRKEPSVENGFGTTWLGCLVDALGEDWQNTQCRGSWSELETDGEVLKFHTETAWAPCNDVFELVREKFPSLRYYFMAEEPGMCIYETNDEYGTYFRDRYFFDAYTPDGEYVSEYFETQEDAFKWIEENFGKPISTAADVTALNALWQEKNEYTFCYLHEYDVLS